MSLLDFLLNRETEEQGGDSEMTVPDRSAEIERLKTAHTKATEHTVKAGVLSPQDYRIRRAMTTTAKAIKADRHR